MVPASEICLQHSRSSHHCQPGNLGKQKAGHEKLLTGVRKPQFIYLCNNPNIQTLLFNECCCGLGRCFSLQKDIIYMCPCLWLERQMPCCNRVQTNLYMLSIISHLGFGIQWYNILKVRFKNHYVHRSIAPSCPWITEHLFHCNLDMNWARFPPPYLSGLVSVWEDLMHSKYPVQLY